jgi:hypothetical protein
MTDYTTYKLQQKTELGTIVICPKCGRRGAIRREFRQTFYIHTSGLGPEEFNYCRELGAGTMQFACCPMLPCRSAHSQGEDHTTFGVVRPNYSQLNLPSHRLSTYIERRSKP